MGRIKFMKLPDSPFEFLKMEKSVQDPAQTNCSNCGAPVSLDSAICPYCGTPYLGFEDIKKFAKEMRFQTAQIEMNNSIIAGLEENILHKK